MLVTIKNANVKAKKVEKKKHHLLHVSRLAIFILSCILKSFTEI